MERYPGREVNASPLFEPLVFRNGVTMKNRFVKGPMSEGICSWGDDVKDRGYPTQAIFNVYERWSKGGFGMNLTGNIMINPYCLEMPGNGVICQENWSEELSELLQKWAMSAQQDGCLAIAQLGHCGRQTAVDTSTQFKFDPGNAISEYDYVQMSLDEIQTDIVDRFVFSVLKCKQAGFDGIELNSAYGFLLSQFTSAKHNKRTDKYGGQSVATRVQIILDIVSAIREYIPRGDKFLLGLKLNAAEFLFDSGPESGVEYATEMAKYFEDVFDFVGFSGGSTEPLGKTAENLPARALERFDFFNKLHKRLNSTLKSCKLFPSGFRTVAGMVEALKSGKADGVQIARAATSEPDLPIKIKNGEITSLLWVKLPPTEFRLQVACCGCQILAMSKFAIVDGMSLNDRIPLFITDEICKKFVEQLAEFERTKDLRASPVPHYMEFAE